MNTQEKKSLAIYQAENGAIELREDSKNETFWATQKQLATIFDVDVRTINEHLKNIFSSEELEENSVIRKFRITASDRKFYNTKHYNLDAIISVGYRVNSKKATNFRKWATSTLKDHITKGYTINASQLEKNKKLFTQALEDIQSLSSGKKILASDIIELVKSFSDTWFSLESFDEQKFPEIEASQEDIEIQSQDLYTDIEVFKAALIQKGEATELFAQEKNPKALEGIIGNVMQEAFGQKMYPSREEKAAHFLYFIVKNHVFNDGNKRTGAFTFIWFLQKSGYNFQEKISPSSLTTLTLLIAQSDPKEKSKMIGLVLLLLQI